MRNFSIFAALLFCALAANSQAQNPVIWTAADSETIPLEPASLHAGRIYHPAVGGGGMHVQIDSRYPVTVAMAWADEWNAAMQNPGAFANFNFLCMKEHVTSAIYECQLPSERPMIITFRDERRPERPVITTIGAVLGPGARQFFSPNDLRIQYYNCLQPEFHWRRILDEKYQSTRELIARIKAVLRRSQGDDGSGMVELGGLRIDGPAHRVFAGEEAVPIGPTEYRLLYFFITHPERVYSRTQLLDHVWGGSVYVEERTVDVHIRRLRKTLEPWKLDDMVQTVRGTGYRFSTSA